MGDVGEPAVAVVSVETIRRGNAFAQAGSVHKKDVDPAVVIVIDECYTAASRFDDVALGLLTAEHGFRIQARTGGDIGKAEMCGFLLKTYKRQESEQSETGVPHFRLCCFRRSSASKACFASAARPSAR